MHKGIKKLIVWCLSYTLVAFWIFYLSIWSRYQGIVHVHALPVVNSKWTVSMETLNVTSNLCFAWEHWWFWFNRQYQTCWCLLNSDNWQDWHDMPYLMLVYNHFSLFFHILINIHEYANEFIQIYVHRLTDQCLSFTLVPVWFFYLSNWSSNGKI